MDLNNNDSSKNEDVELYTCPCCGHEYDGNAQCYCMCYGCENCQPGFDNAIHESLKIMDNNIESNKIDIQNNEYETALKKDLEKNKTFEELSPNSLRAARLKRFSSETINNKT